MVIRPLLSVKAVAEVIFPSRRCWGLTDVDSSHRILAVLTGCEIQNMTLIVHDRAPEYRRRIAHERGQRYEGRSFLDIPMLEDERTPLLRPELEERGLRIAIHDISPLMHAVRWSEVENRYQPENRSAV